MPRRPMKESRPILSIFNSKICCQIGNEGNDGENVVKIGPVMSERFIFWKNGTLELLD